MNQIPRFSYGAGPTVLTMSRPMGRPNFALQGKGAGYNESAALVPAAWVTQWSHTMVVVVRLLTSEWPAFRAFLMHALQGNSFTFYPSTANLAVSYTCYLVRPTIKDYNQLQHQEYLRGEEFEIEIRRTDRQPIDHQYA